MYDADAARYAPRDMARPAASFVLLASLLAAAPAAAQSDAATATALFNSARADMKAGDYARACAKLSESYRLVAAPGTLLNLADCEEKSGRLATAWQRFVETAQRMPSGDERIKLARERAAALEARVPRVSVRLAPGSPSGARVTLAGKELGGVMLGMAMPLDPGTYDVEVNAPAHLPRKYSVEAAEGKTVELVVGVGEPEPAPPPATPSPAATPPGPPVSPPPPRSASNARVGDSGAGAPTAAWVALGVGAVGAGVGVVSSVMANEKREQADAECPAKRCSPAGEAAVADGRRLATIGWVGYGVGLAGLGVGALLLLTGKEEPARMAAGVTTSRGGGGVALWGRF